MFLSKLHMLWNQIKSKQSKNTNKTNLILFFAFPITVAPLAPPASTFTLLLCLNLGRENSTSMSLISSLGGVPSITSSSLRFSFSLFRPKRPPLFFLALNGLLPFKLYEQKFAWITSQRKQFKGLEIEYNIYC